MSTTTPTTTPTEEATRELGIVPLPSGALPCLVCGIAVDTTDPDRAADLVTFARYDAHGNMPQPGTPAADRLALTFTTCDGCRTRHALAEQIIDAHPALRQRIGQRSIAVHRISIALDALALLEKPMTATTAAALNDRQIVALIDLLGPVGSAARWASRFSPITVAGARTDTAAAAPFAHVGVELLAEARYQGGQWLAAKREDKVKVPCPSPSGKPTGCAMCGLAAVTVPYYAKAGAWTEQRAALTQRGGSIGHTCPPCTDAIAQAGGPGPTALRTAVLEFVDPGRRLRRRAPHDPMLQGLVPWAASGTAPSRSGERFAYLGTGLADVRRIVQSGDYDGGL